MYGLLFQHASADVLKYYILKVSGVQVMVKQLSLSGMLKGSKEIVEEEEKRKPGRPPKVKDPQDAVEEKAKRPVGRPKKVRDVSVEEEEMLNELVEQVGMIQDLKGMVKEQSDEPEVKDQKVQKLLAKISRGIHEINQTLSPGKTQATSLPLQDQTDEPTPKKQKLQDQNDEQTPKKQKPELQIVQDSEAITPSKSNEEIVQACREAGKKGAQYGYLGGRPAKVKDQALSAEDQIVQHQIGMTEECNAMRAIKARERDESFGFRAKARFCEIWKAAKGVVSDEEKLMSYFVKQTGRERKALQEALQGEAKWNAQLQKSGMLVKGISPVEAQLPSYLRKRYRSKAIRALGGGRKSEISFMYPVVKTWFENERSHGNFVDKEDLVQEFERVMGEVVAQLEIQNQIRPLSKREMRILDLIQEKLRNLHKGHVRRYLKNELQRHCKARFLKPQRVMNLSMAEERARAEASWQEWDFKMALAAFGSVEDLRPYVANPEDFVKARKT